MTELGQAASVPDGAAARAGRFVRRLADEAFAQTEARVLGRIERDLRDPRLCPARIAAQLRLSPRDLRAVFAPAGETVDGYILRRRLEECAREFDDPARDRTTIGAIALSWGFDSAVPFSRSFREQFGMSPRQYRSCAATRRLATVPGA